MLILVKQFQSEIKMESWFIFYYMPKLARLIVFQLSLNQQKYNKPGQLRHMTISLLISNAHVTFSFGID